MTAHAPYLAVVGRTLNGTTDVRFDPRYRYPHVLRIVERYVGDRHLAYRCLVKALTNETAYVQICRSAFARRHLPRKAP